METLRIINYICTLLFFIAYSYQLFFIPVAIIFGHKKKAPPTTRLCRYAILICARNEQTVIRDLIDSIHRQT